MSMQDDDNVQQASALDYPFSVKVAGLIHAEPYHCWYNARDSLQQLPGLLLFATYTEGWLVAPKAQEVQVIEHGWLSQANGRIVDPSIVLLEKSNQDLTYFPALHASWSDMQELSHLPLPLAHLFSPGDELGHPDYRAAYDAALASAEQLAASTGRRVQICPSQQITVAYTKEGVMIVCD